MPLNEIDDATYTTQTESNLFYSNHSSTFYIGNQPYVATALQGSDGGLYVYRVDLDANNEPNYVLTGSMQMDDGNSRVVVLGPTNGGGEIYLNGVQTDVSSTILADTQNYQGTDSTIFGVSDAALYGNGAQYIEPVDINGTQFLFVNSQNGAGIHVWSVNDDGELAHVGGMDLGNGQNRTVYGMEVYTDTQGTTHVYVAETELGGATGTFGQTTQYTFDPATGDFSDKTNVLTLPGNANAMFDTEIYHTAEGETYLVAIGRHGITYRLMDPATGEVTGPSNSILRSDISSEDTGGLGTITVMTDEDGLEHLVYGSYNDDKVFSLTLTTDPTTPGTPTLTLGDTIDANVLLDFDTHTFDDGTGPREVVLVNTVDANGVNNGTAMFYMNADGTFDLFDSTTILTDDTAPVLIQTTDGTYWISDPDTQNSTGGPQKSVSIVCFTAETKILTQNGEIRATDLQVGDMVLTEDRGYQPLRWIGRKTIDRARLRRDPSLLPVTIEAGALGPHLPRERLTVSRQHRILVQSAIVKRTFGEDSVLIPAIKLAELPGVYVDENVEAVEYVHILFDNHEIVTANGARAESLYLAATARDQLGDASMQEIYNIFPEFRQPENLPSSCRTIVERKKLTSNLIRRHVKNNKDLVHTAT